MIIGTMQTRHVEERAARLRELAKIDPLAARFGVDELRLDVLTAIANGSAGDPRALAAAALVTCDEDVGLE